MLRDRRLRLAAAWAATLLVLGPLAWLWQDSLLPHSYSVLDMGYADDGGAAPAGHASHGGVGGHSRSVANLVADPNHRADVTVTLTARKERFRLASGREVDGYTLNAQSPGPLIEVTAGQLVQVHLINESVPDGVTLHWHGVDVPNAADGVAGVTQDAVGPGREFVYRFVADQPGTFWYHSHQVSHQQVIRGLLGPLVVRPAAANRDMAEVVALTHLYNGVRTINGQEADLRVEAESGKRVRIRVINTDNGPVSIWVTGAAATLVALDAPSCTARPHSTTRRCWSPPAPGLTSRLSCRSTGHPSGFRSAERSRWCSDRVRSARLWPRDRRRRSTCSGTGRWPRSASTPMCPTGGSNT